ncbi:MAG: transglutaminase family protein [Pseudomonadota bacterium]
MTIEVALRHQTRYRYRKPVTLGPQVIRLRPAAHGRTTIKSYAQSVSPADHFINWQQDPFGNFMARLVFPEPVSHFEVTIDLVAELAVFNPFDFFLEPKGEHYPFAYVNEVRAELEPYLKPPDRSAPLDDYLKQLDRVIPPPAVGAHGPRTVDFLVALNQKLEQDIDYVVRMEPGVQTPTETLQRRRGSCRDSAWLLIHILRHYGIAARFVSGYLIQLKPDQESLDGPSGASEDFTDLHAWTEAYLPGAGWVGLDPTSGLFAGEGHIPLAATPTPGSAAPITGTITGDLEADDVAFDFNMGVTRLVETPRVTKPYSDAQWQRIDALGEQVDRELVAGDVRLTVGGEPTFVTIDDPDGAEWNTDAVGPTKRHYANALLHRLRQRFAPQGLLHFGQGKWYPGEQLPRWALALYWRDDGEVLWQHAGPRAGTAEAVAQEPPDAAATETLERFAVLVARDLGVDPAAVAPAYEDPLHFMDQEAKLAPELTPANNKLEDPQARARLARVFERGLTQPTGYVLPIQRWNAPASAARWMTELWQTRSGYLLLIPGDSQLGYRLPLTGLPHLTSTNYPNVYPADPHGTLPPLPTREEILQRLKRHLHPPKPRTGQAFVTAAGNTSKGEQPDERQGGDPIYGTVRTALSFEWRDGVLCLFMPPLANFEDYLEIATAAERAADELAVSLQLEGYPPPFDPRVNVIKVTPDPGVIEVNIQPAKNWRHAVTITETLYEEARLARLDTQKFMVDGRHTGTGGGNHLVLGGENPADSPFLRRPDLLKSLIAYWQQHPSLSYLFSGLFIGPTSQAPRIDEARLDSLYEMDIAFAQVPDRSQQVPPPWLVDRIFRNLLIDVSGNTHRSEICIDKLYSPDGPTGRLGLVEFRAFEMPPHAQMSLLQQLLLRALVARFWNTPQPGTLVRWDTQLHDRFMLPAFVLQDLRSVLRDLNSWGYPFEESWFAPHLEFRFPRYGRVEFEGMTLELRQALEPWHVMGEEGAVGGTVRYVDSSVERLQVKLSGAPGERFIVVCNNRRVPLAPTGTLGELAGGVRFRAWQPASALHPTIGVNTPLSVDIYDLERGIAVAGCTYFAAHPGGRSYDTFPINANEAESRRLARLQVWGAAERQYAAPPTEYNAKFPLTLDLRRPRTLS